MGQRAAVSAAAFAFLRIYERLEQWEQQARSVGYFDEGYAASQLWKADWERFGGAAACDAVRDHPPKRSAAAADGRRNRPRTGNEFVAFGARGFEI